MTFLEQYAALPANARGNIESVAEFVEARLIVAPGAWMRSAALYAEYVAWALVPVSHTAFSLALKRLGLRSMKSGCIKWMDIALKD